ncbi:hypothetical protein [Mesorhizobium sp. M0011]|jgi:hypothetical protein|uniref:hypothetical protein n=1 Tax=Mesorhizobium sp. M0011 TaxID=2956839 RepID=UPI0033381FE5
MNSVKELLLAGPSTGLSGLARPTYSPGQLLEDEDLTAAVDYTRNLTRLLFRSLFGCGVICGLKVEGKPICKGQKLSVQIKRGLGLDCGGNPIEVPRDLTLEFDPGCDPFPKSIWVVACHTCQPCRSRETACSHDDDATCVKTRLQDGYKIKLYPGSAVPPPGVCYCGGGEVDDCGCGCGGDCGECILIARLDLILVDGASQLKDAPTDVSMVRQIRPAMAQPCPPQKKQDAAAVDAAQAVAPERTTAA